MTAGQPRVIRIEKLPRQWSLVLLLAWSMLAALPVLFAEESRCGGGLCYDFDGLYEGAPLYFFSCAWGLRFIPMAAVALLPVAAFATAGAWRLLRARIGRVPLPPLQARLGAIADGTAVRVRGRVRAPGGFTSRAGRRGAVIASYLTTRRSYGERVYTVVPFRVLEATDFHLVLAGGEEISVCVSGMRGLCGPRPDRGLLLGEAPLRLDGGEPGGLTHDEVVIADGDAVEVIGVLGRVVDPGGEGGYRGGRLIPSLRSEGPVALAVQLLDEPFFAPDSRRVPAFTPAPPSAMPRG